MHELSIAVSLVDLACDEMSRRGGVRVDSVHLRLGALAGVVKEALLFSFQAATEGTALQGARLEIQEVPVTVWCGSCGAERVLSNVASRRCPICNAVAPRVLRGEELELFALGIVGP